VLTVLVQLTAGLAKEHIIMGAQLCNGLAMEAADIVVWH